MDLIAFLKENLKDVAYIVGAIATFIFGTKYRKLTNAKAATDVQGGELDNVEAALKIYRVMLDDLQKKLTEAEKAYDVLAQRFHTTLDKKNQLEADNKLLRIENELLKDEIKKIKQ